MTGENQTMSDGTPGAGMSTGHPLALGHLRVLDLGIITAGGATSQMLADMGADVIKVESPNYFDSFRRWTQVASGADAGGLDASPPFQSANRNKRGMGLDLKHPNGPAIFLDLVRHADVVIENFSRGALDRLGLGFDALKAAKSDIVLASISSQGLIGPEAGYVSYGSTLEALGGLMSVMGYDADHPRWTGTAVNYPDQLVSILAPGFILATLRQRDRTGEAIHLDFAQRESVTFLLGEQLLAAKDGIVVGPSANRHPVHAPQGVYPCKGSEQWIAVTVRSDREWRAFCAVLELGDAAHDGRFATQVGRAACHELLDRLIAAATADRDRDALAASLDRAGIAAAPVLAAPEVLDHPQLAALDFFQWVESPNVRGHKQRGFAARFSRTPGSIRRPAPRLGEHSREVLKEVAGYSPEQIEAMIDAGAVYAPAL
ncbi:MAG: frc [Bradyrhizobium sp.]|nr:frc [Bradyrhizobium sp.]